VLKAGSSYVPLDPGYPPERLAFMVEDAGMAALVTQEAWRERFTVPDRREVVLDGEILARRDATRLPGLAGAGNTAYVIYTSGSTGQPKGVCIEHGSAVALLDWAASIFEPASLAGVLASTSICFDLSIFEIFLPLARGGTVVLADSALHLPSLADAGRVTLVNTVPSVMAELVAGGGLPPGVRTVNLAGEALPGALVQEIYRQGGVREVYNLYGPSEDATYSTVYRVPPGEAAAPAIGRPIAGTRAYLLDRDLRPVPVGVPGELFLGGLGLARGYLGRPGQTAEKFVPDDFGGFGGPAGARLYRTGDLARWRHDGNLDFLGRLDHQVKIRGFRIELGEIEAVLAGHPAVRRALVLVLNDRPAGRLVAYVGRARQEGTDAADLSAFVAERLPRYMVPSAFVVLDALPLLPNGKVDRKALPPPDGGPSAGAGAEPRGPVEELLCEIWSEVLGTGRIGIHDDFFALGGHSLLATRLISRVRRALLVELPLVELFRTPTVAGLARWIAAAMEEKGPADGGLPLERIGGGGPRPLSHAQQRLWFLEQLEPGSALYNLGAAFRMEGTLDTAALAWSLDEVRRRHEVLRTAFRNVGGEPVQVVLPATEAAGLPQIDLGGLPADRREPEADRLGAAELRRGFDLAAGAPMRAMLLRLGEASHRTLVTLHHIVADGWSVGVLLAEVAALYGAWTAGAPSPLPEPPVRYTDFAVWQRRRLAAGSLAGQLAYWKRQLSDLPARLSLPTDRVPAVRTFQGARWPVRIGEAPARALRALGRSEGATPFMVLLAGFQAALHRLTGERDLAVGTPVANRGLPELEGLIGLFVNTLVLRGRVSGDLPFADHLAAVRQATIEAHAHQDLPFELLVEELQPVRDTGTTPLFQVAFALQDQPLELRLPGLRCELLEADSGTAKFDLSFLLAAREDGLAGHLEYASDLFDRTTAARLASCIELLLEGLADGSGLPLSRLPLMSPAMRHQMTVEWSGDGREAAAGPCVHRLFARQAGESPEALAVSGGGESLTYAELDRRSLALARALRSLGVGPEVRVGVCLDPTPDLVVALLAVLRAGGAYLPLDPALPAERLIFMLEDSSALALVTRTGVVDDRVGCAAAVLLYLDEMNLPSAEGLEPPVEPGHLAYVIYTSGSTGRPKGVGIPHSGLSALVGWHLDAYALTAADRVSQVAGLGFDAAVWEIWPALAAGASLHLADGEVRTDPERLMAWLTGQRITVSFLPTPLAEATLAVGWPGTALLRVLLTGGDRLSVHPGLELPFPIVNHYGPTESSVVATRGTVPPSAGPLPAPTIGRPVSGTRAYLLDRWLEPVPAGVAGEIHLAGAGLARGYLGRPDLTAERFVPADLGGEPGGRLYCTGDLARHLADGRLDFLGRIDGQVKIRGFRIELGEVEVALAGHAAVREVVVAARPGASGAWRLVAYLVVRNRAAASAADLRLFLRDRLPEHMIPSCFVFLERLPLTANGKVDRTALPEPPEAAAGGSAPATPVEELLAGIWSEVLGREPLGTGVEFFESGGHSLLAAKLLSRVREACGVEIPLRELFDDPSLAGLARSVERARSPGTTLVPRPSRGRLGCLQRARCLAPRGWLEPPRHRRGPRSDRAAARGSANRLPRAERTSRPSARDDPRRRPLPPGGPRRLAAGAPPDRDPAPGRRRGADRIRPRARAPGAGRRAPARAGGPSAGGRPAPHRRRRLVRRHLAAGDGGALSVLPAPRALSPSGARGPVQGLCSLAEALAPG
jgi:amino acid adenylation domain-containing protein